jgi:flagellin
MPFAVNSNPSAVSASHNLSRASDLLQKSLGHLSSGKRINSSADDAGGIAVSYKLDAQAKRTAAGMQNIQNALSLLQDQDAKLDSVGKILDRVAELRTMSDDITKNSGDIENYSKEFNELQLQLFNIGNQQFNGIDLFSYDDTDQTSLLKSSQSSYNNSDGSTETFLKFGLNLGANEGSHSNGSNISINITNLQFVLKPVNDPVANGFIPSLTTLNTEQIIGSIERLAYVRTENGAEQNRLLRSAELMESNYNHIDAAHGRIVDADIALESTRFAKFNIMTQSSAAMNAQANRLHDIGLQLMP